MLDELVVPYAPLLGNHDVWPYVRTPDGETPFIDAPEPFGDRAFEEVFGAVLAAASETLPDFSVAPMPGYDPEHDITSNFVNCAFDYGGLHFVCLDLVTRAHAPPEYPGVGPEADLHDFEGGTWPWLLEYLHHLPANDASKVLVFSHHPPVPAGFDSLSPEEYERFTDEVVRREDGPEVLAFFAGHWHMDMVIRNLHGGVPIVITEAAKEVPRVRIVQMSSDGSIDFDTLR